MDSSSADVQANLSRAAFARRTSASSRRSPRWCESSRGKACRIRRAYIPACTAKALQEPRSCAHLRARGDSLAPPRNDAVQGVEAVGECRGPGLQDDRRLDLVQLAV